VHRRPSCTNRVANRPLVLALGVAPHLTAGADMRLDVSGETNGGRRPCPKYLTVGRGPTVTIMSVTFAA
jgi:hypothetical protein